MSKKLTPEKMLLRLFRVAEILAKTENRNSDDTDVVHDKPNPTERAQLEKSGMEHTRN